MVACENSFVKLNYMLHFRALRLAVKWNNVKHKWLYALGFVALILFSIWYDNLEELWQITMVDHFFSMLPNHNWKSDFSVVLLAVLAYGFLYNRYKDRKQQPLCLYYVYFLVVLYYSVSRFRKSFDFYSFSFAEFLYYTDVIYIGVLCLLIIFSKIKRHRVDNTGKTILEEDAPALTDELSRSSFVRSVVSEIEAIKNVHGSFTIGINETYGMGKTTCLEKIYKWLRRDNIACFHLSPWLFSNPSQVSKEFFSGLENCLHGCCNEQLSFVLRAYRLMLQEVEHRFNLSFLSSIFQGEQTVTESYQEIKSKLLEAKKKIVVLVDDVDRLCGTELFSLFKLIRNTGNFPYVVFVLAYDRNYVCQELKSVIRFEDTEEFLKKIINMELLFPAYEQEIIENLAKEKIVTALEPLSDVDVGTELEVTFIEYKRKSLFDVVFPNIRELKRFINMLSLDVTVMSKSKNVKGKQWRKQIMLSDLLAIELIKYLRVDIYKTLRSCSYKLLKVERETYSLNEEIGYLLERGIRMDIEELAKQRNGEKKQIKEIADVMSSVPNHASEVKRIIEYLLDSLFQIQQERDTRHIRYIASYGRYFMYSLSLSNLSYHEMMALFTHRSALRSFVMDPNNGKKIDSLFYNIELAALHTKKIDYIDFLDKIFFCIELFAENNSNAKDGYWGIFPVLKSYFRQYCRFLINRFYLEDSSLNMNKFSYLDLEGYFHDGNHILCKLLLMVELLPLRSRGGLSQSQIDSLSRVLIDSFIRYLTRVCKNKIRTSCFEPISHARWINSEYFDMKFMEKIFSSAPEQWLLMMLSWNHEGFIEKDKLGVKMVFGVRNIHDRKEDNFLKKIEQRYESNKDVMFLLEVLRGCLIDQETLSKHPILEKVKYYQKNVFKQNNK